MKNFLILFSLFIPLSLRADPPDATPQSGFHVLEKPDSLEISYSGESVAQFVFADEKILRPYFANLHAPGGVKVTRNHPPIKGVDPDDHDTMHPGIWLGFGDINGVDFWRNKGRIEHIGIHIPPTSRGDEFTFSTTCRLISPEQKPLCTLTTRFTLIHRSDQILLIWYAVFSADAGDFTFGDQEEMGFGARVATAISEKKGGLLISSSGDRTAANTWGKAYDWCDYSAVIDGRRVGLMLMADPSNFRKSWWHNRDYGLMVANPFGREAMHQGAKSEVTVKSGEKLTLRFGALLHASSAQTEPDLAKAFEAFLAQRSPMKQ